MLLFRQLQRPNVFTTECRNDAVSGRRVHQSLFPLYFIHGLIPHTDIFISQHPFITKCQLNETERATAVM